MKSVVSVATFIAVTATGLFTAAPTLAQEQGALAIEEILVTARKRDESLQDVPVAVSAFSAADIVDRGMRGIDDVARNTPGLSFAKAFGRSTDRPVIRGQGNVLAGVQFGVESGVAYFVDGTYYAGDLSSLDLANLERVEVIRGPQAALYGRNTYSGAINFITKGPGESMSGSVRARFGEDNNQEINATIRGPISDKLSGSLTGRFYSYDGEFRNVVTDKIVGDEETTSISGRLDFAPTDSLKFSARVSYQEDRDGTRPFFLQPSEANNCMPGTRSNAAWLWTGSSNNNQYYCGNINRPGDTVALNDGDAVRTVVVPGIPDTPLPGYSFPFFPPGLFPGGDPYNDSAGTAFSGVDRDITTVTLMADYDFSNDWSFHASFASRQEDRKTGSDSDHSSVNYLFQSFAPPAPRTVECTFCASGLDEYDDYSAEVRLQSPLQERTRWLFGAFYYTFSQDISDITWTGIDPVDTKDEVDNFAIFGSIEHDFSDVFSTSLELRYFDETKRRNELDVDSGLPPPPRLFEKSFRELAPRVTFDYKISDDILLYGVYAKGYKPGGVIGSDGATLLPPTTTYEQEESDNFELGLKNVLFDGRMVANVGVFFIDAKDIQLTTALSTGGSGALTSVVTNQGSGETFGAELEIKYLASDNLTLGATYALADTEFTQGCDDFQWTATSGGGLLTDAPNCSGSNPNGNGNGSIKGNQFPLSSKNQFSAYADYRWDLSNESQLFANLSYSWEDKKPVQVHNLAWVPAATLVDLQFGWETSNWTLMAYGRNLTDEDSPSMVTRWLQDPLLNIYAGGAFASQISTANAGAAAGACDNGCSTNFPRAFFADMRMSRNFGVEFNYRFGN